MTEQEALKKWKKNYALFGHSAFEGKINGRVRLVNNPNKAEKIKSNDIIVSRIITPDYFLIIKKAAGFITDHGGILSHAEISARELQKPCLIGTKIATKVLKDGDWIEMDTEKGVVKIKRV